MFNSHSEDNQDLAPDTLRHSGLWSLGIGHTGNPSDHEHSAHRLQSVRPDSVVRWSILLNRTLLELRSELEHRSASLEPDIVLMLLAHHGGITAHIVRLFSKKFSRSLYFGNHLSESIHTWTIGT